MQRWSALMTERKTRRLTRHMEGTCAYCSEMGTATPCSPSGLLRVAVAVGETPAAFSVTTPRPLP